MMRIRPGRVVLMVLLLLLPGTPVLPHEHFCPGQVWNETIYYSDYFQTAVGFGGTDCDGIYDTWGTLDGEYMWFARGNCCSGNGAEHCFQKINGEFISIPCPA